MKPFTYASYDKKNLTHLNFEDALNLAGRTVPFPLQKLRELLSGKIDVLDLLNGTLTNFEEN